MPNQGCTQDNQGCTQEWMQEIVLLIDNELPDCRRQQTDAHIQHCRNCQVFYHALLREDRLLAGRVQHDTQDITPVFTGLVMNTIEKQTYPTLIEILFKRTAVFYDYMAAEGKWHTAVTVTILGCLFATYLSFQLGNAADPYYLPMMKNGEPYTAILPDDFTVTDNNGEFFYLTDGSVIYAAKNTRFVLTDYPKNIDDDPVDTERRVILWYGHLYLDVAPANQGFTVVTPNAETKVFGTQFYVYSSIGSNKNTTVAVKEGRVMVEKINHNGFTVLTGNLMTQIQGVAGKITMAKPFKVPLMIQNALNAFAYAVETKAYENHKPSFPDMQMDIQHEI